MKHFIILLLIFGTPYVTAQMSDMIYESPLAGQTVLSGSFGEPRSSHFHAGIDFKPQKGRGLDTVYSVSSGHISRIVVSPDGYGNALYIEHDDGYTSVYAHLNEFCPRVRRYIDQVMYERKVYQISFYPGRDDLLIAKGDILGIMGNTGRSSGTHLHFEIRKTNGQFPVNPFHFGIKPTDSKKPVVRGIVVYYLTPDEQVMQSEYFPLQPDLNGINRPVNGPIRVPALLVGLGVHAYDTMDGASNHNGIHGLSCAVDGKQTFGFTLDMLDFNTTKFLHAHMDYAAKLANRYVTKCYKESHNSLDFYTTDENLGKIYLYEDIPRQVRIEVTDYEGNVSYIALDIFRNGKLSVPVKPPLLEYRLSPTDSLRWIQGRNSVRISSGSVVTPEFISIKTPVDGHFDLKQIKPFPLFKPVRLTTAFDHKIDKLIFASKDDKGQIQNLGGSWVSDTLFTTEITRLDSIYVLADSIPPAIDILKLPSINSPNFKLRIRDNYEALQSTEALTFTVEIDGEWFLCQYDLKSHLVTGQVQMMDQRASHKLTVRATDSVGNQTVLQRSFPN